MRKYSNIYRIALGECGDNVVFSVSDEGDFLKIVNITADCCNADSLVLDIEAGSFRLEDDNAAPKDGHSAHPIDDRGNYFVSRSGELLY